MRQYYFHALANGSCVHGLARNSRDFDYLAAALTPECRVVCMDVAGRGESDWLDSKSEYTFSTYQSDAAAMLARVSAPAGSRSSAVEPKIDWVGTSMGGLIGLFLVAKKNSPIRRASRTKRRSKRTCARCAHPSFRSGTSTGSTWHAHGARRDADGSFHLRYDPAIGEGLHGHIDPEFPIGPDLLRGIDLWNVWSKIECPTLVLHGAQSEVLLPATLAEMRSRKPAALMNEEQIGVVKEFLPQ